MFRKVLTIGGGLIALYLVVAYGTSSGKVITDATAGGVNLVKAFQART